MTRGWSFLCCGLDGGGGYEEYGSYEIKGQKALCRHWETRVRLEVLVSQSCPTLCNPMDCNLLGSFVHGILQGCHSLLQGIFPTQELSPVSCIASRFFTIWATREATRLEVRAFFTSSLVMKEAWVCEREGRMSACWLRRRQELWTEESKDKHTASLPELSPAACWFCDCCCHVPVGL